MKDSILQQLIEKIKDVPIFFITNDAERALGLEKILPNFHIVCVDENQIVDYMLRSGVKVFCLERELEKKNVIFRNSARLLRHELAQQYLDENTSKGSLKPYIMVFKISSQIERLCEKFGYGLLNTSSGLNRKFERKISQYESMKELGIFPPTYILQIKDIDYAGLQKEFGGTFVIQFDRGHTGLSTLFIEDEPSLKRLNNLFPNRVVRVAKKIIGPAFTLNACVTKRGVAMSALSYQITGIPDLTSFAGGTVGNDWKICEKLPDETRRLIMDVTTKIGQRMAQDGYKGMFGIDVIIEKETGKVYVIEVNARQPASVAMFNKLQLENEEVPLSLLHIAEFLNIDYDIDIAKYNEKAMQPREAAQLFMRNVKEVDVNVRSCLKPGIYKYGGDNTALDWSGGRPVKRKGAFYIDEDNNRSIVKFQDGYSVEDIEGNEGFVILAAAGGRKVSAGSEVARIQAKQGLVNEQGKVAEWALETMRFLRREMI